MAISGAAAVGGRYSRAITGHRNAADLRSTGDTGEWDPTWPAAEVVVLPGLPGWFPNDNQIRHPFPNTTTDVVKVLRGQGLSVEHVVAREGRQIIALKAAEYWLPILVFSYEVAVNVSAELLAGVITQLFGAVQLRRDRLHVRYGHRLPDGTVSYFEAHGPGDEVVKAIRAHGKQRR